MKLFTEPLLRSEEISGIKNLISDKQFPISIDGCIDSQKCHIIYGLSEDFPFRLIVAGNEVRAKEIYEDYSFFDKDVFLYPAKDVIFFNVDIRGNYLVKQRLTVVKRLLEGEPSTIITTIDAFLDNILPINRIRESIIRIFTGGVFKIDLMTERLVNMGFNRVQQVEAQGQFAVRGGIIDIFNVTDEVPYRIELWDDEVDSIRTFDPESQRSIENVDDMIIFPAAEYILSKKDLAAGLKTIEKERDKQLAKLKKLGKEDEVTRLTEAVDEFKDLLTESCSEANIDSFIKYFCPETVSFLDYFDNEKTIIWLDEPARLTERMNAVRAEFTESMSSRIEKGYIIPGQADVLFEQSDIYAKLGMKNSVYISALFRKTKEFKAGSLNHITVRSIESYNNSFELLVKELKRYKKERYKVIIVAGSTYRAKRMTADLIDNDINAFFSDDVNRIINSGEICIVSGAMRSGIEYPLIKFVIISEGDIFNNIKKKRRPRSDYKGEKITSFSNLHIGDYVVHENHGLGIYKGVEKVEVDKIFKDYIKIEYAGGSSLYIPVAQLNNIQKYSGAGQAKPKLNNLGSQEWKKTVTRVRGAVKELAGELTRLYALRTMEKGFAFSTDTVWQAEFEEHFEYNETDDQLRAIEETKKDMESSKIMDRLICGDVGYGKTEIALRAAFKAVQDGKQVIMLVPTTILAQQHFNTFKQRMKDYPVRVDMLSRFRTKKEQEKTIKDLKRGVVDILIGTHRVLSKDVEFKDPGLLIIDEEQRFGVSHKEKIKKLKTDVDVLTLSATPIPRTLHMSLSGIRDMSILYEAPVDRRPVQTFVLEYNEEIIRDAILREMARGGQIYYVYNRVESIVEMANIIQKVVPEANVAYAHGRMSEKELENILYSFINKEIDVLVSTTIIEIGLDIANVNTMIIHDSDRFGLSQLYQLRGRIGRSSRTAYAFLMYRRNKILKEVAEKRLTVIRDFTELGSGFKIAMRDLEIRGAGNLLGAAQSGHMEAVGYDLYCKMLNDAVRSMKGNVTIEETFETEIDINVDAFISSTYINNELQKLDIYKRIAAIDGDESYSEMQDELIDRFGEIPKETQNLLDIALLRVQAHEADIKSIKHRDREILIMMYNRARIDVARIPEILKKYRNRVIFQGSGDPYFLFKLPGAISGWVENERQIINDIKSIMLQS